MANQAGYVELEDSRLYYEVTGAGEALVLVNGWDFDMRQWDAQVGPFSEQYRVVRWDARGYGKTEVTGEVAFRHYEDLRALLDHLQIERCALVGLSWGGREAVNFALEYPEYLSKLILISPAVGGYDFQGEAFLRYDEAVETAYDAGDLEQCVMLDLQAWLIGTSRQPEQVDAALRERASAWLDAAYRGPEPPDRVRLDPPAITRLDEIKLPLLVILGAHDFEDFSDIADQLLQAVPDTKKAVIEDAAHVPHMERPDAVNRLILDFLSV